MKSEYQTYKESSPKAGQRVEAGLATWAPAQQGARLMDQLGSMEFIFRSSHRCRGCHRPWVCQIQLALQRSERGRDKNTSTSMFILCVYCTKQQCESAIWINGHFKCPKKYSIFQMAMQMCQMYKWPLEVPEERQHISNGDAKRTICINGHLILKCPKKDIIFKLTLHLDGRSSSMRGPWERGPIQSRSANA